MLLAVTACLATTSCGGGDRDTALKLARQACQFLPDQDGPEPAAATGASSISAERMEELVKHASDAADQSGRAARLDPTWNELARALSNITDDLRALSPIMPTPQDDRTYEQRMAAQAPAGDFSKSIRTASAECRKAS
ncbi:hypothetical protein GCM10023317_32260 [Actinopolymorpha pittospori]